MSQPELPVDEHLLNKPPYRYRVNYFTKIIFLLFLILSLSFYFYLLIDRKISQKKNIIQNQFAAITRTPELMSNIKIFDIEKNKLVNLKNYISGWTLINIWATWCPSCQAEMPSLDALQLKLKHKLKIIALSVDDDGEVLKKFVQTNKPLFVVLWDKNKSAQKFFKTKKYPESFLLDSQGRIRAQISGPRDWVSAIALQYFENNLD